jgi:phosphopantothenoylcysteine decarboxylase/phosphopantothenate--cysteine ligase
MRIVLGVGGGIAAYKAAFLLRLFKEAGHDVRVMPTAASEQFVGRATWEALSGNPVSNSVFDDVDQVNHVRLGQEADLILVVPATADLLAKAAAGLANDLLTSTLLVARCPVVFAPAMHTEMWLHPATAANVATLRSRGTHVLEPAVGRLTGADTGPGRLPEPAEIFAAVQQYLGGPADAPDPAVPASAPSAPAPAVPREAAPTASAPVAPAATREAAPAAAREAAPAPAREAAPAPANGPLSGRIVTITAGGTREPLDPVRYLGNRSSGKQGAALARAALAAGARVRFVAAHMEVEPPAGVELARVSSALELREAAKAAALGSDVVIMAAAVADFRPASLASAKMKKSDDGRDPVIQLVRNPDILREMVEERAGGKPGAPRLIVGFAAETGDSETGFLDFARQKLRRKGCDLLVVNQVGSALVFGQDSTRITILDREDGSENGFEGSKDEAAEAILAAVALRLEPAGTAAGRRR